MSNKLAYNLYAKNENWLIYHYFVCAYLGATLLVAINSIKKGAKEKEMSFKEYVLRGHDPSVNVVLLEDMAAVIGVVVAAGCMGLTSVYHSSLPDAIGSIVIGGILASVASFIIYTNVAALVGRSITAEHLERINAFLEKDVMIRAIYDVKGISVAVTFAAVNSRVWIRKGSSFYIEQLFHFSSK